MIHNSIGASRRVAWIVGALSAPLLAIGKLAQSGKRRERRRWSLNFRCAAPIAMNPIRIWRQVGAGCARIKGYIAAGERFGSDERIGGRHDPFAPIDEPAIARNQASGLTIVGAPLSGGRFLAPTSAGDIAR